MQELIKIETVNGEQLVSGRELHEFLEIVTPYKKWFDRMCEYGFTKNVDFTVLDKKVQDETAFGGYRVVCEHFMKISMAKEISMIQRNEKGKQAREYFIKCEEAWNSPEMIIQRAMQIQSNMIVDYKNKVSKLENKIKEDKPRVSFAKTIEKSKKCILVREFAKILANEGIKLGEKKLYKWLRDHKYILKYSTEPMQSAVNQGLFRVHKKVIYRSNRIIISTTTKITGKGQIYFLNLLKKEFLTK